MRKSLVFKSIFLAAILWSLLNTGCSHFNSLIGDEKPTAQKLDEESSPYVKFSENPAVMAPTNRQYRRMTRSKMEEESELGSQAGSMWVGEGQGAYLFAQNKTRKEGDLLNVKLEGAAQKQVETKVSVIKKLLKQLEEEEAKANQPDPATLAQDPANPKKPEASRSPASEKKEEKDEPLDIGVIPTKITEKQADGTYRIKGQQPFMIGQREYKVLVTGSIRPEDFNDDGISSGKILDPQYDVVSIRRSQSK